MNGSTRPTAIGFDQRPRECHLVIFWTACSLLTDIGLLGVWIFGVWLIFAPPPGAADGASSRHVGGICRLMNKFFGRMETLMRIVYTTQRAAASSHRIFEILDRTPSVPEPIKPVHPTQLEGPQRAAQRAIQIRHARSFARHQFEYRARRNDRAGRTNRAGKSTLINLICRFFDVAEGEILVDGVDIRSYPVAEYRKHIGIVLQDPFLFYGTIAENIAYGRPEATQAEIVAAARAARAHEFILQLPDGLRFARWRARPIALRRRAAAHFPSHGRC